MHTFTLPSGPEVGIVEMTGVKEDLLTNQRFIKTGEAVNQILGANVRLNNRVRTGPQSDVSNSDGVSKQQREYTVLPDVAPAAASTSSGQAPDGPADILRLSCRCAATRASSAPPGWRAGGPSPC